MDKDKMDALLTQAYKRLLRMTRGDEGLATDALPWIWQWVEKYSAPVCCRMLRRALYKAKRTGLWGMRQPGKRRDDAQVGAFQLLSYRVSCRRFPDPAREAAVKEAVRLVRCAAVTAHQWRAVETRILGCVHPNRQRVPGCRPMTSLSDWQRFRLKCRRLYPSLVGAF